MSQALRSNFRDWTSTTNSAMVTVFPIEFIALNPPEPIRAHDRVPNAETETAIRDTLAGKDVVRCESASEMFRKLGI